jgi:hypothetical protein
MEKLRIIIGGYIGLYPTGGAAWDYLQYPLGLKLLGHDVYYIEDTLQYPVFQKEGHAWNDASGCITYLKGLMGKFGFQERWAYRDVASGSSYGMTEEKILRVCNTADLFINISCSTFLRDEYLKIPKRILLDSDPMFTQMQYAIELQGSNESKDWSTKHLIENHSHLFTFGENINGINCKIPRFGYRWNTTRQPICLHLWDNDQKNHNNSFTSIMNWSGRKKLIYENDEWGQKDVEFEKYKELPSRLRNVDFEVVVNRPLNKESDFNPQELKELGWRLLEPQDTVADATSYKAFILNSTAEFSVAKETYVKSNSGWFSCRSACYLAAGKPVVTEETEWSKYIPTGDGLFSFSSIDSAIAAVKQIHSNVAYHSKMAKEIAAEYFDSNKVLTKMLENLN